MKKLLSVVITLILAFSSFGIIYAGASAQETALPDEAQAFKPSEASFLPNLTAWGWTSAVTRTDTETGVRVQHTNGTASAYQNWVNTKYNLNGLHFKVTVNSTEYNDRIMAIYLKNSGDNGEGNQNITVKFDINGGQLSFSSKGAAIDHSGLNGYNSEYPGRVFATSYVNSSIDEYEWLIYKNLNGELVFNVNGFEVVLPADVIESSGINLDAAYIIIGAFGGSLDYTLNYIHGGGETCTRVVNEVNSEAEALDLSNNYAGAKLYTKADILSAEGKANINRWLTLSSMRYDVSDKDLYAIKAAKLQGSGWWHLTTDLEGDGVNINVPGGLTYAYSHCVIKKVNVDGLTIDYTHNDGYLYAIAIDNDTRNPLSNAEDIISINFNDEGKLYPYINGSMLSLDDITYSHNNGAQTEGSNTIVYCPDVLRAMTDVNIVFKAEDDGGLSMYVNNVKIFTISASVISASGLDLGGSYVKFAAVGWAFNIDLHYVRSGDEVSVENGKPVAVPGDVNADKSTDLLDLVRIKKYVAGVETEIFSPSARLAKAVDEDDKTVNANDLVELKHILLTADSPA